LFNFASNIGAHHFDGRATRTIAVQQLNQVPVNAVILGAWSQITPLHYLQLVEGVRRDVSVIHAPITDPAGYALMQRAFDENRPLYVLMPPDELRRVASKPE
jgi:hypothetical protein